ncbi:MAG TPA: PadR family transcriptional regulator [Kofleriaceae bacterium]|nr:PadR family transcriptional regulator [Kofleriaceae bacterium]
MSPNGEVWQGTLALMVLKTLEALGPLHGYGIGRRIEQTSGNRLIVNYGTLYPALLKLEQEGYIASSWGKSENNRRAKFYRLTRAGRRQVVREAGQWEEAAAIVARFLRPESES